MLANTQDVDRAAADDENSHSQLREQGSEGQDSPPAADYESMEIYENSPPYVTVAPQNQSAKGRTHPPKDSRIVSREFQPKGSSSEHAVFKRDIQTRDRTISQLKKSLDSNSKLLRSRESEIEHNNSRLEERDEKIRQLERHLGNLEISYSKISVSGSYPDNSATPTCASTAFSNLSQRVHLFSKTLATLASGDPSDVWAKINGVRSRYTDFTFLRPGSYSLAQFLHSEVMKILFEGFENEIFNLEGGYSVYPDPVKRKKKFFDLFQHFPYNKREPGCVSQDEENEDQFEKYYRRSKAEFCKLVGIDIFEGGSQDPEAIFMRAARSVWAAHLLSFSFEPPASLFRIRNGAEFDPAYMETPAYVSFNEHSSQKVAFMLTPGLRVDKVSTIKSEIYPVHETII